MNMKNIVLSLFLTMTSGNAFSQIIVYSSNIHAISKIQTSTTNVLIAVPWKFYTPDNIGTDIPVMKLVKPFNLDDGDLLLAIDDSQRYKSWMVIEEQGVNKWEPVLTVSDELMTKSDCSQLVSRGLGLWVIRHKPKTADGHWKPIYVYGQYSVAQIQLNIDGGTTGTNAVMIANPDCTQTTKINEDIEFTNVNENDTLSIPNGSEAWDLCLWDKTKKKWYCSHTVRSGRKIITSKNYDLMLAPGHGFWYIRRASDLVTIMFK